MNWLEKYSYNREPVVDGWAYRYEGSRSQPQIWRRKAGTPQCNFETWKSFDISDAGEAECKREWRRLCNLASDKNERKHHEK